MIFIMGFLWEIFFGRFRTTWWVLRTESEISVWLPCSHHWFPCRKEAGKITPQIFLYRLENGLSLLELPSYQQWQLHLVPWQDKCRSIFNLHELTDFHGLLSFFTSSMYHCFTAPERCNTEGKSSSWVSESQPFFLSHKFSPLSTTEDGNHFLKRLNCLNFEAVIFKPT